MRSTLLVSTAVLLAGIGLASAQNTQSGGQSGASPSAQSQGGAAAQERQSPQSSPSQRGVQSQQGQKEPMQKDTTGQAQQRDQAAPSRAEQKGARDQQNPTQAQSPQRQQNGQAAQGQAQQGSETSDHRAANDDQKNRPVGRQRSARHQRQLQRERRNHSADQRARRCGALDADRDLPGMARAYVLRRERRDHHRRQPSQDHCGDCGLTFSHGGKKGRPEGRPFSSSRLVASQWRQSSRHTGVESGTNHAAKT